MAWRLDEHVTRGEIDSRVKGRVTGRIWLAGIEEPLILDLEGNPWRDLAGQILRFTNPNSTPTDPGHVPDAMQSGVVGDITASRKVRVPDCPIDEFIARSEAGDPPPCHWANSLYLEWFSERNGRVVIESATYQLTAGADRAWEMTAEEEIEQQQASADAMTQFIARAGRLVAPDLDEEDDDAPRSDAEARADEEAERMDVLTDRIHRRLQSENLGHEQFGRIWEEERERLRRERGEPEPEPPTPEQERERAAWIEEANAAAEEALEEAAAESWKGPPERHPLVAACSDLAIRLHREAEDAGWVHDRMTEEHPLQEILTGVMIAAGKLAGALGLNVDPDDEWPPDAIFAGNVLVRLKNARGRLRDALAGLAAADEQSLATAQWRASARTAIDGILCEVNRRIAEVRDVLE